MGGPHFLRLVCLLLVLIARASYAEALVVERPTPAVSDSGVLSEDIGIETLGGVFTPLIVHGCRVPCTTTQMFSTAEDHQTEIKLFLFRGNSEMAKDAHLLGIYVIFEIPPLRRGEPQVAVTLTVERDGISISAMDRLSQRPLHIQRREF